jgi:hypothetical protein
MRQGSLEPYYSDRFIAVDKAEAIRKPTEWRVIDTSTIVTGDLERVRDLFRRFGRVLVRLTRVRAQTKSTHGRNHFFRGFALRFH